MGVNDEHAAFHRIALVVLLKALVAVAQTIAVFFCEDQFVYPGSPVHVFSDKAFQLDPG
jgi:hypothetical protein